MRKQRRIPAWAAWVAGALALIVAGIVLGAGLYERIGALVLTQIEYTALAEELRRSALYAMAFGGMVVAGVGILVLTLLHMLRRAARLDKEAAALNRKNQATQALNERLQQLSHHQRLETIGTLTASIAHEFNNLLTPIMGYSMMALEKLPPEETELYDDLLEIYNTSSQAKRIISRLNDLSRKGGDNAIRVVSPDELIRKTLDIANPAEPENVQVRLDLNCWDQRLKANEIQLSQMLLNLILNAFQAMEPGGGTLTVQTTFDEEAVHIRVSDTGCGIPKELQSRIFEPFFTTKDMGYGTGLGLAIVAQVVEDHGGRLKLESHPGEGTSFLVSLPRRDN